MLDGELVIRDAEGNLEFDALQQRIHPAESRIKLLAKEIPAGYVAFDLLAEGDESLLEAPLPRAADAARGAGRADRRRADPGAADPARAEEWLATIEGTMAKQLDARYVPGKRKGMAKVKRERTIDCVVMGWRPGKEEGTVGSLILGLYDGDELRSVGHISGFSAAAKRSMRELLAPLETGESGTRGAESLDRRPRPRVGRAAARAGDRGRLRPRRAGRIRHGARFHRFRDDKSPKECLFSDLDE